jgi:single-strand DNA-binding protein
MTIECAFFGSLARDAEAKTSKSGKPYLRANVRTGDGDAAQFINTMVFDTEAIAVVDKLKKGARVYVEGKLSLDEWTAQDGSKRTGLSCMSFHTRLSAIGRNKPRGEPSSRTEEPGQKPKQDFPRSMHAPLGNGAADLDDSIPF